jgi:Putative carbonic anhydrase
MPMPARERDSWRSSVPFTHERIGAVALYCSDGRFGDAFDEFLHDRLGLPRYDRLAVPGGAACLAGHSLTWREEEAVAKQLRFLIEIHRIGRVVLIAHRPCAFYTERLGLQERDHGQRQHDDLVKAAAFVRRLDPKLEIDVFLAALESGFVVVEPVGVSGRSWHLGGERSANEHT